MQLLISIWQLYAANVELDISRFVSRIEVPNIRIFSHSILLFDIEGEIQYKK